MPSIPPIFTVFNVNLHSCYSYMILLDNFNCLFKYLYYLMCRGCKIIINAANYVCIRGSLLFDRIYIYGFELITVWNVMLICGF